MPYTTPIDLADEGVVGVAEPRLTDLIAEATAEIDRLTGWFFEPRLRRYVLNGRGVPTLSLPCPPIRIDQVWVGGGEIDVGSLVVVAAPVEAGFNDPRLIRPYGHFPKGYGNVVVEGLFGFTEADGTVEGRVPWAIRRACILLVQRNLSPIAADDAFDARHRWRIIEEKTRDQSYKLDKAGRQIPVLSGDPDVDVLLMRYLRPRPMGAA